MADYRLFTLKSPPISLVSSILPTLRNSDNSLLTYYSNKYLQKKKGIFYTCFVIDKTSIVGWGIITENFAAKDKNYTYNELFIKKHLLLMLYVKPSHRKLKLGSKIIKNLLTFAPKIKVSVIAYDKRSWGFFHKQKRRFTNRVNIVDWR